MVKSLKNRRRDERRAKEPREIRIDIAGQVSVIDEEASQDPQVTALVLPQLEYDVTVTEQAGPLGHLERRETETLHGLHLDKQGAFATGHVPRVSRVLREHGYRVKIVDRRDYSMSRFEVDEQLLRRLHGEDRRLAKAVSREPVGLVEVRNSRDLIDTMRLVIDLYPRARVLIPVATRQMARKIARKLDEAAVDFSVRIRGRTWPDEPQRCLVCTFWAINTCREDDWDIVLLPDAVRTTSQRGVKAMTRFHGPYDWKVWRVYGFIQAGVRFGRREQIRLEGICGEVIYRRAPERARVRVLWLGSPTSAQVPRDAPALLFKRKAYWHNARRNDFIAGVARAFMRQDTQKLRKYGVRFDGDGPVLRHAARPKLVLLVASTEQAREVAKRLPDWDVLTAAPNSDKSENGQEAPGKIITEMYAAGEGLDADVLIRAGGSAGKLCLKGLPPELEQEERREVIVVDFDDQFDDRATRDAKHRSREYESLGWETEPTLKRDEKIR